MLLSIADTLPRLPSIEITAVLSISISVDSHGVVRVRYYVEGIERGLIKPCGNVFQVRDWSSIVVLDSNGCLGIPAALRASSHGAVGLWIDVLRPRSL